MVNEGDRTMGLGELATAILNEIYELDKTQLYAAKIEYQPGPAVTETVRKLLSDKLADSEFHPNAVPEADGRWGRDHIACGWLNSRLYERGVCTGDWSWKAWMKIANEQG